MSLGAADNNHCRCRTTRSTSVHIKTDIIIIIATGCIVHPPHQICRLQHHFFSVTIIIIIIAIIVIIMVMETEHSVFNSDQRGPVGVQSRCNSIFLLLHHNHRHNHRHNHLLVDFKYHELLVSFVITILQSKSRSATTSINQPPSLEYPGPLFNLLCFPINALG